MLRLRIQSPIASIIYGNTFTSADLTSKFSVSIFGFVFSQFGVLVKVSTSVRDLFNIIFVPNWNSTIVSADDDG